MNPKMKPTMRRSALLVPVLLVAVSPAASASGTSSTCHHGDQYVDTLTITLPPAPRSVHAGSTTSVTATVTRATAPAGGVEVHLRLQNGPDGAASYASGRTTLDGRVALAVAVPREARGPLRVSVEALSPLATVPCYGNLEEHGLVDGGWGRAVS
jgi:hypothetical protein